MLEAFKMGGWGMFPTLLCGVLAVAVSVRYAARPEKRTVPLIISLNVLTALSGILGFVTGVITTINYIHQVEGGQQGIVAMYGVGESLHNIALALILMVMAAVASSVGAFRLNRQPSVA